MSGKPAVHILVPVDGHLSIPCGESPDARTTNDPLEVTCGGCRTCLANLEAAAAYRRRHNLPQIGVGQ